MSFEIIFVFAVLLLAVVLFVSEKLRVDLVALLVLVLLLVSEGKDGTLFLAARIGSLSVFPDRLRLHKQPLTD